MPKDVFGREMDLKHKTTITNKSPLAPNPYDVTPQNDPVVLFDPGTYRSTEFKKGESESLGASQKPTVSQGEAHSVISALSPNAVEEKWGSYVIPPKIVRVGRGGVK